MNAPCRDAAEKVSAKFGGPDESDGFWPAPAQSRCRNFFDALGLPSSRAMANRGWAGDQLHRPSRASPWKRRSAAQDTEVRIADDGEIMSAPKA